MRDNTLFVYTKRNTVVALTAAEGRALWSSKVTPDQVGIKPPIIVKERVAFPASVIIEMHNLAETPQAEAIERELKAALQEWMILQRDFLPLPVPPPPRPR